ncbi:MAG: serine O-acetyltransferase EpsC [Fibrobacterota bacterium]
MNAPLWKQKKLKTLTRKLVRSYEKKQGINQIDGLNLPNSDNVVEIIHDFFKIIFPGFVGPETITSTGVSYYIGNLLEGLFDKLFLQIHRALEYQCPRKDAPACKRCDCGDMAYTVTVELLEKIPAIREMLKSDVQAALEGDPAARSVDEVIVSYPFIKAITVHRLAHVLYQSCVPLIPRIMSEWAHKETGIDIHPGARIGHAFFIDHGTGVVIGETTLIGNNVKIYQGVTLGALSFPRDERGRIIKGAKRHPTLEDNVTVYANATILGGNTVIGKNAVVGGNTWVTSSVNTRTMVSMAEPKLIFKKKKHKKH